MPNLTLSVPHQLGRAEAKRRIQEQLEQAQRQYGAVLSGVEQRWTGDPLDVTVRGGGQSVTGHADVGDSVVDVSIELPWMFALLAGPLKGAIEQQARRALGHNPAPQNS
jgi:putative polyhydroxyalkanoate system protein